MLLHRWKHVMIWATQQGPSMLWQPPRTVSIPRMMAWSRGSWSTGLADRSQSSFTLQQVHSSSNREIYNWQQYVTNHESIEMSYQLPVKSLPRVLHRGKLLWSYDLPCSWHLSTDLHCQALTQRKCPSGYKYLLLTMLLLLLSPITKTSITSATKNLNDSPQIPFNTYNISTLNPHHVLWSRKPLGGWRA